MKRLILLIVAAVICPSQLMLAQQSQRLTADKHNEYGLVYSLPITHLTITVTAEKTTYKAGEYYKYAQMYLKNSNAIASDSQHWDIIDLNIQSYGTPDTQNQYLMQFRSGTIPFLMLNDNGLPLSLNIEETQESQSSNNARNESYVINENKPQSVNATLTSQSGEFLVSESSAKRAEIAAKQIYKIRESRTNLIIGEADQMPPDGEAMKLMLKALDEQEAALLSLFLGEVTTEVTTQTFNYTPTPNINREVIFRLSDFNGVVDKNDLSGAPVYLDLTNIVQAELPVDDNGVTKSIPKGAVMYKIPGEGEVQISYDGAVLFSKKFEIAQFGVDFGLNQQSLQIKNSLHTSSSTHIAVQLRS
ncbi:MAG: DUF4831 family protein [Bacteroidales bacterium]